MNWGERGSNSRPQDNSEAMRPTRQPTAPPPHIGFNLTCINKIKSINYCSIITLHTCDFVSRKLCVLNKTKLCARFVMFFFCVLTNLNTIPYSFKHLFFIFFFSFIPFFLCGSTPTKVINSTPFSYAFSPPSNHSLNIYTYNHFSLER